MTNIYTYCLFDGEDTFYGVYSSLKAIYRDALQLSNRGSKVVQMKTADGWGSASLTDLRNTLKGEIDTIIEFRSGKHVAKILKTKLKE
jgi:hypothetical protein